MSILKNANEYFRNAEYKKAANLYEQVGRVYPELSYTLAMNLHLALQRAKPGRTGQAPGDKYKLLNERFTVDVVIPVYNALDDVRHCLSALATEDDGFDVRVFVVDDGSREDTAAWLRDFCEANSSRFHLFVNKLNLGYTVTVNRGLRLSTADFVVTLNSDTRVTSGWLTALVRCMVSDDSIGIAGPLSNAASWQNVPELYEDTSFAINTLPTGFTPNDMAQCVRMASHRVYPRVPFVNGFCFMIARDVFEEVGFLDEETFPTGYGEENDFCLRAAEAGFTMAIADDAYVFHAKSKSFGHEKRKELAKRGGAALKAKHGAEMVNTKAGFIREMEELRSVRARVKSQMTTLVKRSIRATPSRPLKVLFCLPVSGGGGGVHSIVQETQGLRKLGVDATVGVPAKHRDKFLHAYRDIRDAEDLFLGVRAKDWSRVAANYDVMVGTIFTSMPLVREAVDAYPHVIPAYYVQDYEPFFYEPGSAKWAEARQSYELIPEAVLFAKTHWIRHKVLEEHGVYVHKVSPSIDHKTYTPVSSQTLQPAQRRKFVVSAMIRPKTPRRGAYRTMGILAQLEAQFADRLRIEVFGTPPEDNFFAEVKDGPSSYVAHGLLTRPEVAQVLQKSDLFIDLSDYQAFGRTALEAMATGAAAVVPQWGGGAEYSWSSACLKVDPFDPDTGRQVSDFVEKLAAARCGSVKKEATRVAQLFTVERAVLSEKNVFTHAFAKGWNGLIDAA
ncbi:glycosyltransferase [Nesterenkonia natronophila]|uniref:Glycosyltransferase n=1 Tax=Nesterenkonia natronophila TaxID=2174932 RepID=A0A3A4F501_9MICC|nr:glycosyltransferase [Nesterenkonia natronophila]RJN32968.1 glycosyltransferase [Nesterenkonia natronophila]